MWREGLLILILAGLGGLATWTWHPKAPALYLVEEPLRDDEMSLPQVQQRWQGKVLWLDARPKSEYEKSHIPGALLLNEQNFDEQLFELLETLQTNTLPVIIYCSGQRCDASRLIRTRLLERMPLENVYVLQGGWQAWQAASTSK